MNVRPVTIPELPRVASVGFTFFKEGDIPGGFVPEVFIRNWTDLLLNNRGVFYGAFTPEGMFTGGLGALLCPDLNNGQVMAVECFWYVLPEFRGGTAAGRLLKAFERWAREQGAKRMVMVHLLNLTPTELHNTYKRLGYRPVEVNYVKEL